MDYEEYLVEKVEYNISYSEYISEAIGKGIEYHNKKYIAENRDKKIEDGFIIKGIK